MPLARAEPSTDGGDAPPREVIGCAAAVLVTRARELVDYARLHGYTRDEVARIIEGIA